MEIIVSIVSAVTTAFLAFVNLFQTRRVAKMAAIAARQELEHELAQDLSHCTPLEQWERMKDTYAMVAATFDDLRRKVDVCPPRYPEAVLLNNSIRSMEKALRGLKNLEQNLTSVEQPSGLGISK